MFIISLLPHFPAGHKIIAESILNIYQVKIIKTTNTEGSSLYPIYLLDSKYAIFAY